MNKTSMVLANLVVYSSIWSSWKKDYQKSI